MKKLLLISLALILSLSLFACGQTSAELDDAQMPNDITEQPNFSDIYTTQPHIENNDGIGGATDIEAFNPNFEVVPNIFVNYATDEAGWVEFLDYYTENELWHEMMMMIFVQYFDMSRETFDMLNARWAEIIIENEWHDMVPFNADVIFTFDNELIREYHRNPAWLTAQRYPHLLETSPYHGGYILWDSAELAQVQQEQVQLQQQLEQEALRR